MKAPLTPERLAELLEAYGAAPERWPEAERGAAEHAIAQSADARALREEAAALDRLLATPVEPPSPALAARVLAAAPARRLPRPWRALAVAVPLAAAATVTLWLVNEREPAPRPAGVDVARVGDYASPTDWLLQTYGVDVYATVPSIGCADSAIGCPGAPAAVEPYSQRQAPRRSLA